MNFGSNFIRLSYSDPALWKGLLEWPQHGRLSLNGLIFAFGGAGLAFASYSVLWATTPSGLCGLSGKSYLYMMKRIFFLCITHPANSYAPGSSQSALSIVRRYSVRSCRQDMTMLPTRLPALWERSHRVDNVSRLLPEDGTLDD